VNWTVLIPLNVPALRKSRLSGALAAQQREALAEALYRHVLGCVERAGLFRTVVTFSPAPSPVPTELRLQRGSDLNVELARARCELSGPLLVLNADLPLLTPQDLRLLAEAAERTGCALAVDRHGSGTNAVALLPEVSFAFAFGRGSLSAHLQCASGASVLRRAGLACDLDTPADIAHVLASGHALPATVHELLLGASRMAHAV
jgi:2-phospho-L-lactate/phosphoenolpyruvate guanylyltransferase